MSINDMYGKIETAFTLLRMELENVNARLTEMEQSIQRIEINTAYTRTDLTKIPSTVSYSSMASMHNSASSADLVPSEQSHPVTEESATINGTWHEVEQVELYLPQLMNFVLTRHKDEIQRVSRGASAFLLKSTDGRNIAALIYRYRPGCGNEILRHIAADHVVFHEHVIDKYVKLLTDPVRHFYTETHTSVADSLICRGVAHVADPTRICRVLPHIRKTVQSSSSSNLIITNEHDYRRSFKPYGDDNKAPLYSYIIPPGNRIRMLLGRPQ